LLQSSVFSVRLNVPKLVDERHSKVSEFHTIGPNIEKALAEKASLRAGPLSSRSNSFSDDRSVLGGW
jgi:hypothetical protein